VYSVPHLGYHLHHLGGLGAGEAVVQVIALGSTLVLAVPLLLPVRGTSPADPSGNSATVTAGTR
jgi:hypothetical protein